jgi:hypothetical protein
MEFLRFAHQMELKSRPMVRRTKIRRAWILIPIMLVVAANCVTDKKIIVKSAGEEIHELEIMIADVADRDWNGHMERMKEGITDQLKRAEYGMETGKITDAEGADIIYRAEDVINKADEMARNIGTHSGGGGGGHRGGGGGGFGGGHGRRHDDSDTSGSDDSSSQGRPNEFLELKHMIDNYFTNTVTASAVAAPVSGTAAAPAPEANYGTREEVPGPPVKAGGI